MIKFSLPFHPSPVSILNCSRHTKYAECQGKHKQAGDYIPIKILAALIVIDRAEILAAVRATRRPCAHICTHKHTHRLNNDVDFSFFLRFKYTFSCQGGLVLALLGSLDIPTISLCCNIYAYIYMVYQSAEAGLKHTELRRLMEVVVFICMLRQCDISKYTQQVHTVTYCKDKRHKITHKLLTSTNTQRLHTKKAFQWNGMDGFLFLLYISVCVYVSKYGAYLSGPMWVCVRGRLCTSETEVRLLLTFRRDEVLKGFEKDITDHWKDGMETVFWTCIRIYCAVVKATPNMSLALDIRPAHLLPAVPLK